MQKSKPKVSDVWCDLRFSDSAELIQLLRGEHELMFRYEGDHGEVFVPDHVLHSRNLGQLLQAGTEA